MASGNQQRAGETGQVQSLLEHYRPIDGVVDEMVDASGKPRPLWKQFIASLQALGPEKLTQRFARADQYLRDAGVYYRVYDNAGANERAWPLAHVPLLIDEKEWSAISAGLIQRADLFERIAADIYGPNRLVDAGLLPPGLIAGSPEYLRPLAGTSPAGGHFLHFCAFELGRGPDGRWWVLGDRMQAPSGAGFALENRVATTRALSELYGELHVHRLAGFFRRFRDALNSSAAASRGRVAILTPGPLNETYYEHAYIARYLGIMLLEGEDLVVAKGRLMVRTVAGLVPISVLWRRLDAAFADPLELRTDSQIGTPGLVEVVRQGAVTSVNGLGSGLLETRALLAFLPRISQELCREDLLLPSVATWWCGQEAERKHVLANLDRTIVGPALSTRLAFEDDGASVLGASLSAEARADLVARIETDGSAFVGQEAVTLSTTPVFVDGRLEPRPASLRVYLARTTDGWTVMPGGFARVGFSLDPTAIAMQRGGQAADVWVVSDRPVERETLFPRDSEGFDRTVPGSLPSRAAENLMWLGRYIERAEDTARILRAYHVRLAETSDPAMPLLSELRAYLDPLGIDLTDPVPPGLLDMMDSAVYSAGQVRDRFSPDGWLALKDLSKTLHLFETTVSRGDDATRAMTVILRKLAGFSGLLHENMYRFTGWRFLEIGRRLERGIQTARMLARLTRADAPEGALDMMLEIGDSVMTHRRQYPVQAGRSTVVDLLVLDPLNPRSIFFQVERLKTEIGLLPGENGSGHLSPAAKDILKLNTALAVKEPSDMTATALNALADEIGGLYSSLAKAYFS
ncbi:circularly permuted type 2 ATP-grasp protein [Mesorhizobium sp. NPDC059025]|uniref:circularly permuted type 2 ATP-grasp protein n=1 Tax=unclassified Mesorhizobium TaxID=325217 RepID=UPI00367FF249